VAIALTKSTWFIVGWVAQILGILMNGIYLVISKIGVPNVGLAIILFTIIMYALMTPLQIQQQRFTKLNAMMQPELQKIQSKYKGKTDQISQQKQMDETNAVYEKYGTSPTGSCVQLLIQMPILFALYQVIYHIPGYITAIGNQLRVVAEDSNFVTFFTKFIEGLDNKTLNASMGSGEVERVMDTVYKLNTAQWASILEAAKGQSFEANLQSVHTYINRATNFVGLNISDSPMNILQPAWAAKNWGLIVVAVLIPVLAWATQMWNLKVAQAGQNANKDKKKDEENAMAQTMNSMNTFMPLMSAFFCLTLPVGIGIYWIIGAVVRVVQMLIINKSLDSETEEEIIKKALEKSNKKRAKKGLPPQKITNAAHLSTKTLAAEEQEAKARAEEAKRKQAERNKETQEKIKNSTAYYNENAKPGSIASKANMVRQYEERQTNKKKK
jgi:YidC/Oxa1 family membrane protein insertase